MTRTMAVVRRDLQALGAPLPAVEDSDWQDWPGAESAFLRCADGTGMGVWVDTTKPEAEQVAMLADQVQDWVVELAKGGVTNWPQCPEHPRNHPMQAVAEEGVAAWVCPVSKRRVGTVGELGSV